VSCLCHDNSFISVATHCIKSSCTTTGDQESAYNYAVELCATVGVQLPSFQNIGETSGSVGMRVGYNYVLLTVVVGGVVFVGGLS
jgi:CFEM domain